MKSVKYYDLFTVTVFNTHFIAWVKCFAKPQDALCVIDHQSVVVFTSSSRDAGTEDVLCGEVMAVEVWSPLSRHVG